MTYDETTTVVSPDTELRKRAVTRLKKRRDLRGHLLIYTLVNSFLVVIWWMTSNADSFFWPIFPIVGWGIGVVMNIYDVYFTDDFDETDIQREMEHLAHRR